MKYLYSIILISIFLLSGCSNASDNISYNKSCKSNKDCWNTCSCGCINNNEECPEEALIDCISNNYCVCENSICKEFEINIKDECNVVPRNEIIDQIVTENEKPKFNCEINPNCEWRGVGGKKIGHYACCPKDLDLYSNYHKDRYQRCFIRID